MKMNHGFMRNYNVLNYRMAPGEIPGTVDYIWEDNPKMWTAMRTRASNRRPLNMQPPMLPTLVWLSHGVFKHGGPYTSVSRNEGRDLLKGPPWSYLRAQGYAILVPFLFSLLGMTSIYFFCLRFFSWKEGLVAVALMATAPLDIAVGTKLYTDGMASTLTFTSMFIFLVSLEKSERAGWLWAAVAGLLLGLAFLSKLQSVVFALAFIAATFLSPHLSGSWLGRCKDKRLWIAGTLCFLVILPWNLLVYHTYGTPLPNTPQDPGNAWFRYVFGRPPYAYFLGIFYFMPISVLGWAQGLLAWRNPRRNFPDSTLAMMVFIYPLMMILLMKTGTAGLEHRYLMPIYPLLAILSARALTLLWERVQAPFWRNALILACVSGLLYLGWRATEIGLYFSFRNLVTFAPYGL